MRSELRPLPDERADRVFTIGHSTRSIEEFVGILRAYGIGKVVDVRSVPRSRHNPQFNKAEVAASLNAAGIEYEHAAGLGGFRKPVEGSPNTGWRKGAFKGYADYMMTPAFQENLEWLIGEARRHVLVIMCAEAVPWRCHRSLIADALTARGFEVVDIIDRDSRRPHSMTGFAVVDGSGRVTYPAPGAGGESLF